jgi:glycosyltransferase involved in cell wall biosynthesis
MSHQPIVSILMTAYNREKYISQAVESVLASTFTDFELIIVDDVSTDRTLEIARLYEQKDNRIRVYVNEKNLGDYPNRNKAASYATGKYIKYADADDMLYDYGLEVMVRFTEMFPEAGFGLGCYPADDRPFPYLITPREIYLESFGTSNHFDRAPGSGLIKREVFDTIGGFSGKRMVGDYEFWFKISRYYSMVKLPVDLYWNRIHPDQESQSEYAKKNYAALKKEILEAALSHADCPLTAEEIKNIREKMRQIERKNRISSYLRKANRIIKL